eukprot:TRINITY_DN8180_c0_g1_i2.p1 TRINITY_DN8180_c0_g1~~TRINITY_DN8180_c0_g1_i2.p1  ORF type:complete len:169 (+),score=35.05 TRINITY_DN8180_c0_g1_i2:61-507(+)
MSQEYSVKRIGIKYKPAALIIDYVVVQTGSMRRRQMPIRTSKDSSASDVTEDLKDRHFAYLGNVPSSKIEAMVRRIQNHQPESRIDPNEDLNIADDATLKAKKAIMNKTFEANQVTKGDPDYVYDKQLEFDAPVEASGWDSEESDGEW